MPSSRTDRKRVRQELDLPDGAKARAWLELGPRVTLQTEQAGRGGSSTGSGGGWNRCIEPDCAGAAARQGGRCFVHTDVDQRSQHVASGVLNLSGCRLSEHDWQTALPLLTHVRLLEATAADFEFDFKLIDLPFQLDTINLTAANFYGHFEITNIQLRYLMMRFVVLSSSNASTIRGATISGSLDASYGSVERQSMTIVESYIGKDVSADGYVGVFRIGEGSTVGGRLSCRDAELSALIIQNSVVSGPISLDGSTIRTVHFSGLTAEEPSSMGTVRAIGLLADRTHFAGLSVEVESIDSLRGNIDLSRSKLDSGGIILARNHDIRLDSLQVETGRFHLLGGRADHVGSSVTSVAAANLSKVVLSAVDLRGCLLSAADELSGLRLDSTVLFNSPPAFLKLNPCRRCLFDEVAWRSQSGRRGASRWLPVDYSLQMNPHQPPQSQKVVPELPIGNAAHAYRSIRRALEDAAEGANASDFYFGEMEMRRHDPGVAWSDRALLSVYWLVSGYGLRASRALLSLLVVLVLGGVLMAAYGFSDDSAFGFDSTVDGIIYALQTSVPSSGPEQGLTNTGRLLDVAISILGPLFFALAGFAVRERVRR